MSVPVRPETGSAGRIESFGAEVLRNLGLEALIEFLETTAYGVCVTGDDHTWVYVNPAGERIIGAPLAELQGKDYLQHFPAHERGVLLALESTQREGDTAFYTNTVLRPDGNDREMTWSGTVMHVDGHELAPAIFHETTRIRRAQRSAADLGAAAVHAEVGPARADVLANLVHEAVSASRACAAVLFCEDRDGWLDVAASAGSDQGLAQVVVASAARLTDLVDSGEVAQGRSVYVSDAADQLAAAPPTDQWPPLMAGEPWNGAALVGVRRDGQLAGVLLAILPLGVTAPTEAELVLWSSLADQASVALGAERVRERVFERSVVSERNRIARDLHDSVSQALFSLHARAQVIRRALAADDPGLAREAAEDLELLSRQATTELRALLGELRPAGDGSDALVPRLQELAAAVTNRQGLPVRLTVSPAVLPPLPAPVVEHVPRIVGEALHNTVKHAQASQVRLTVTVEGGALTLVAEDDGRGFDATAGSWCGLGQQTMRERAALLGGELDVDSAVDAGTTVRLTVPLAGDDLS